MLKWLSSSGSQDRNQSMKVLLCLLQWFSWHTWMQEHQHMMNHRVFIGGALHYKGKLGAGWVQAASSVLGQHDLWCSSTHQFLSALADVLNSLPSPFAKKKAPCSQQGTAVLIPAQNWCKPAQNTGRSHSPWETQKKQPKWTEMQFFT